MVDDHSTEEETRDAPAQSVEQRGFQRVGPGGVLDHTAMMGTLDTTDTGGSYGMHSLEKLAPIFAVARAHDMAVAARALDPEDDSVSEDQVVVSQGLTVVQGDPEGDKRRVMDSARKAQAKLTGEKDFDPNFRAHFDRRAEAERGWVASMADMRPSMVVGTTPAQRPPAQEEPETEPEPTVPAQREPSEVLTPPENAQPSVDPKPVSPPHVPPVPEEKQDDGENFDTLWKEASERAKNTVDEALQAKKKDPEKGPEKSAQQQPKKPNRASSKADWIAWALYVDPDLSQEKAGAMKREDLIDTYIDKTRPTDTK